MRKILVAVACLGMFAAVANANDLMLYLGAPETVAAPGDFVADSAAPIEYAPDQTITMGIWASPGVDWDGGTVDAWNGIAIDFVTTGDVVVDSALMDNFDHKVTFGTAYRWEDSSDFGGTGADAGFFLISVSRFGVGGLLPAGDPFGGTPPDAWSYFAGDPGTGTLHYWLGNVTMTSGPLGGTMSMAVGNGGIARQGGDVETDLVLLGPGETGVRGDAFGSTGDIADVVFTPEPASLILLGLAGLFLRRR